jgi:cysteine desulfurase
LRTKRLDPSEPGQPPGYSTGDVSNFKHFVRASRPANHGEGIMAERAYLDHNASSPLRPAAAEAMARALQLVGNPSSVHAEGRAARAAIDRARHQVAAAVGGEARNVVFTSGATEALNMLLRPSPAVTFRSGAKRTERLLVLATEHSAALAGGGFAAEAIERIPVDGDGRADLGWLERRLGELASIDGRFSPVTVALQLANSETGVIQPVREASMIADRYGACFICDTVAVMGKIPIAIADLNADAIVLSAHKFGGPKGVGTVILNGEHLFLDESLLKGGGQEMRRRSGTENVAGIVAMGVAAEEATAALPAETTRLASLRDDLLARFRAIRPDTIVFGETTPRLSNTLNLAIPGLKAETAVIAFDLANVSVSSGSACSSGKVKRSHVLDAMGVAPDVAECALRFSLGWTTTERDIDIAATAFGKIAGAAAARAA